MQLSKASQRVYLDVEEDLGIVVAAHFSWSDYMGRSWSLSEFQGRLSSKNKAKKKILLFPDAILCRKL
jgi:hypothetical protein